MIMSNTKYQGLTTLQRWMPGAVIIPLLIAFVFALIFDFCPPSLYENHVINNFVREIALISPSAVELANYTTNPARSSALAAIMWAFEIYLYFAFFVLNWPGYKSNRIIWKNARSNPRWQLTRAKICFFLLIALIMLIYDLQLEPIALSINLSKSYTFSHPIFADYFLLRTRLGFGMFAYSCAVAKPVLYWLAVTILLNFRLFWNKPAANTQTKLESHAQSPRD